MRLKIRYIIICSVLGMSSVGLLALWSNWLALHPHGFFRKLPSHLIVGNGFYKINSTGIYLAGIENDMIYVGSWSGRDTLRSFSLNRKLISTIRIHGHSYLRFSSGAYLRTSQGLIYILDGSNPVLVLGSLKDGLLQSAFKTSYFTSGLPLSDSSFVLRSKNEKGLWLRKNVGARVAREYLVSKEKNADFLSDGILLKSTDSKHIFYVNYYKNQISCFDDQLRLQYQEHTIDTVSHPHIRIAGIASQNAVTLASPPLFVNEQCAANNKYLFIHSALHADNETVAGSKEAAVIDVYMIKDGRYMFSFYINNFAGEKMQDFMVSGDTLVALFKHYLYVYKLKF